MQSAAKHAYDNEKAKAPSRKGVWTGRAISLLVVLFLVFDGTAKVLREPHVIAASAKFGLSDSIVMAIGAILLACTAVYVIPRTAVLGAILLTGYLGGAVAMQVRAGSTAFETIFPVLFGVLVWAGVYLQKPALRAVLHSR